MLPGYDHLSIGLGVSDLLAQGLGLQGDRRDFPTPETH